MTVFHDLVNAILVIVLLYGLALAMRRAGTLKEEHSLILARVVLDLCIPALVFSSLARQPVRADQLGPPLTMLVLEIVFVALAWLVSNLLGFGRVAQGAVVFCSAFGSATFLGTSLIMQVFPHDPQALTEAVLISEIGVGYPVFNVGPVLVRPSHRPPIEMEILCGSVLTFT